MNENPECPAEKTLLDFVAGRLDASTSRQVNDHLDACESCSERVEWIKSNLLKEDRDELAGGSSATKTLSVDPFAEVKDKRGKPLDEESFDTSLLVPSPNKDAIGRLGKYDVYGVVGHGGMGVVFKAFDEQLRRTVAIKVLNRQLATSATARRRFIREARAAAGINHENVVTIYAVEPHETCPFLVMEYVGGGSLRQHIRKHRGLEPLEVIRLSKEIAAGLAAAHAQGVIHRDIKPSNIMLEEGAVRVKITDFGLARAAIDNVDLTSRGAAVGTAAYMSPEQVSGGRLDLRSDLFSLGCVMYAMVAGHSPFRGRHSLEMARNVVESKPPPLEKTHEGTPGMLSDIISRLLEKDPNDRFQSATEVAEVLGRYLTVLNQTPTDEISAVLRAGRLKGRQSRRSVRWVLGGLVVALLAALGSLTFRLPGRESRESRPPETGVEKPVRPVYPKLIEVAKSKDADARSISQALSMAGPGTTIRVTDVDTYVEALDISDGDRLRGIRLEAKGGTHDERATLMAPAGGATVIRISDVSDVVVKGFRIEASEGSGITVDGRAGGIVVDDVQCIHPEQGQERPSPDDPRPSGIMISATRESSQDQPIVVRNSLISHPAYGQCVQVWGTAEPVPEIRLEGNRFSGRGVQVLLWAESPNSLGEVTVEGNLFLGYTDTDDAGQPSRPTHNGLNLSLHDPHPDRPVRVSNNTFLNMRFWIGLVKSRTDRPGVFVRNNLILDCDGVEATPEQLDGAVEHWQFDSNWWELSTEAEADSSVWGRLATLTQSIELIERNDPRHPAFLLPPPDSPLFTSGYGEDGFPSYVGALGPRTTSQH